MTFHSIGEELDGENCDWFEWEAESGFVTLPCGCRVLVEFGDLILIAFDDARETCGVLAIEKRVVN